MDNKRNSKDASGADSRKAGKGLSGKSGSVGGGKGLVGRGRKSGSVGGGRGLVGRGRKSGSVSGGKGLVGRGRKPGKGRGVWSLRKKLAAAVLTLAAIFVGYCVYNFSLWLIDSKLPAFSKPGIVYVRPETTYDDFMSDLLALEPRHPASLERVMSGDSVSTRFKPGLYRITKSTSAKYLSRCVTRGWQNPTKLVISGQIRNLETLASKVASQMMMDSATVMKTLTDRKILAKFGTSPEKLFEMIIPDTYEVYWAEDMQKVLHRLKLARDAWWTPERVALAAKHSLTPEQVSSLASIIAEESNRPEEFPKIASVYLTRLRIGMPLQACPTIRYIYDYKIVRVLYSHLKNPSPYNTYLFKGLPPSPICLPSKQHLEAVLHPDATPYLYFCADASLNGTNVFSTTLAEHNVRAAAYQEALDRQKAAKRQQNGTDL